MSPPVSTITPPGKWTLPDFVELWDFRTLLARFAARDITLRYRQTALGVTWVILQPLLAAGALSFVFGSVANIDAPEGVPYFAYSLVGLIGWNAFFQVLTRSSTSLTTNSALVSKVFFPRLLLPLATAISTAVDVAVSATLLAIVLATSGVAPPATAILALPIIGLFMLCGLGVGVACASLAVRFRDIQYVIPVAAQFLLYASPVAYALSVVPESSRLFFQANPITGLLELMRWSVLGVEAPSSGLVAYSLITTLVLFVGGTMLFERLEREFADVI